MKLPPRLPTLAAFGLLAVPGQSPPGSAWSHLRGTRFTVEWREPTPFPAESEVEIESGSLNVWSRALDWVRLVPKDGSLEAIRVRFRSTPPRAPDRPEVHIEQARLHVDLARGLLDDLGWIVNAHLVPKLNPHAFFASADRGFWASGRVTAGGALAFEDAWGGDPGSGNELRRAKVEAVVGRVREALTGIPFSSREATPGIRAWVTSKISRDYPRLPNTLLSLLSGDGRNLRTRYRWIAAALADESVLPHFAPSALLRVRVVGEENSALEPSQVQFVRQKRGLFRTTEERLDPIARFGEKGVRAAYLEPDGYVIEVKADGYSAQSIPVQLEAAAVRDRTIRLERSGPPK